MKYWTEWMEKDEKRLRAAMEHKGVSAFADISPYEALRLAVGVCTTLGVLRARKRYAKKLRKKYAHK